MKRITLFFLNLLLVSTVRAEDGSQLWLRYQPVNKAIVKGVDCLAADELRTYYAGEEVTLLIDTDIPKEAYRISEKDSRVCISAGSECGLLYGAYALLRRQETGDRSQETGVIEKPFFKYRILNHWDNLDGSIERGYAGLSIFWDLDGDQPKAIDARLIKEYARANASIGINGTVLNNVNASPKMLSTIYLNKVKEIADILRPYGIKVYLSVNFASPMTIPAKGFNGGRPVKTADPLNAQVKAWWKAKAKEIYTLIPDFGGFLVKANSEGQPGPFDYKRTHADGANMLAEAVKPYGGSAVLSTVPAIRVKTA